MKRLFIFLTAATIFGIGCSKSALDKEEVLAANATMASPVTGTWRMTEFYTDPGDGNGWWTAANPAAPEEVTFTENGGFSSNANWPWHHEGYNAYVIKQEGQVTLTNTATGRTAIFRLRVERNGTTMIFNPFCREDCSRRYQKVS